MGPEVTAGAAVLASRSWGTVCETIGDTATMERSVPLTTLLSWAWITFAIEADNAVEAAGWESGGRLFRISLAMWTNGLRGIGDGGATVDELRACARATCNIGGLERWGWISVGETGAKRRDGYGSHRGVKGDTVVRPTTAGAHARQLWPRVVSAVEQRWRRRFSDHAVDSLGDALLPFSGRMPRSVPEVHPSDGFYTHVIDGRAADDDPPLVALLGQALTAFTLEHEQDAAVSLPMGANILRVIGADTARIRDLPRLSGVSKEAVAMTTSYLQRHGLADLQPERSIRLTGAGRDALAGYRARAARLNDTALRVSLDAIVSQQEGLIEGLVPLDGCWRAQNPYLAQTRRLLAEPTAALPWHPMVLHRGGWPDGS